MKDRKEKHVLDHVETLTTGECDYCDADRSFHHASMQDGYGLCCSECGAAVVPVETFTLESSLRALIEEYAAHAPQLAAARSVSIPTVKMPARSTEYHSVARTVIDAIEDLQDAYEDDSLWRTNAPSGNFYRSLVVQFTGTWPQRMTFVAATS